MRRLLSLATALTLVPVAALSAPALAHADQARPAAASRQAVAQPLVGPPHALDAAGTPTRQPVGPFRVRVSLTSRQAITKVEGWVHRVGETDPVMSLGSFRMTKEGPPTYTLWESDAPVDLPVGDYTVVVRAQNAGGLTGEGSDQVQRRLAPAFAEMKATPGTVTVEDDRTVVTGRLLHDGKPLAGLDVRSDRDLALRTTTDQDGRFRLPYRVHGGGSYRVVTEGDARYARTDTGLDVTVRALPTRVTLTVPAAPTVGDRITLTGKAERLSGTWGPLAARTITLRHYGIESGLDTDYPVKTGADGRYSLTLPAPAPGYWKALAGGTGYLLSTARAAHASLHRTRLDEFALTPRTVDPNGTVTIKGRLARQNADGTWSPLNDHNVEVQRSTDGKHWKSWDWASTNAQGRFTTSFVAETDARFRLHHTGSGHRDAFTAPLTLDVRNATAVNGFNASPEPVRKGRTVTLAGALQRKTDKWQPFGGQPVSFYFLPKGSTKWTYLGKATADKYGRFRKGFKATKDGTWRAYYGGTATYAKTYRDDYVDVR
ncbi:hypothetical protein [Actinomadura hibisca]|uniref:hypothetical protein n=1 Tax=Actinomadura hibisca TaxID=68565 RepID=UPI0008318244|nr:hypothetical protein [Actinomadura hibisca]